MVVVRLGASRQLHSRSGRGYQGGNYPAGMGISRRIDYGMYHGTICEYTSRCDPDIFSNVTAYLEHHPVCPLW